MVNNNIDEKKIDKFDELDSKKELKKIVEQVLDTKLLQKSNILDFNNLKKEIEENQDLWQSFEEEIYDFFPEIDGDSLDDCLDEIKKIRYLIGTKIDINWLKKILILVKNKKNKKNIKQKLYIKLHKNILNYSVDFFDNNFEKSIQDNSVFGYLLYLKSCEEELDNKQKKILEDWFKSMEAWIKEGNVLEIYEITIVDGIIVIKGEIHGKKFVIYYDLKNKKFKIKNSNIVQFLDKLEKEINEKKDDINFGVNKNILSI